MKLQLDPGEDLMRVIDAYSSGITYSNRAWVAVASLSALAVFSSVDSDGNSVIFGVRATAESYFLLLALMIGAFNIHYASTHMQAYEFQKVFKEYIDNPSFAKANLTEETTLRDFAYLAVKPGFVRIFPIMRGITKDKQEIVMDLLKPVVDAAFLFFPVVGLWVSVWRMFSNNPVGSLGVGTMLLEAIAIGLAVVSTLVSGVFLNHTRSWRSKYISPKSEIR